MQKINITLYNQNIWGGFPEEHAVANRSGLIRDMIFDYDADICCFQECHSWTIRHGETSLPKLISGKYDEVFTMAYINNSTPIFYKKDRFEVVESGYHLYTGLNDCNSKSLTWCVLKEKESGNMLGVLSTHFWYKGPGEEHDLQRMENAKEFFSYVKKIKEKYDIPVFACGDLNCGIDFYNPPIPVEYLKERMIDIRDIAKKTTYVKTCHDYPARNEDGLYEGEPEECTFALDYVFVSEEKYVDVHSFEVDNSKRGYNSSDHNALIVKMDITN